MSASPSSHAPATADRASGLDEVRYDDDTVRRFLIATVLWGIVGMLVGVIIAAQLAFPSLNVLPELSFGRLRPLHTNAVIFAFVGNSMFAGIYYSTQRLLKTRMANDALSNLHFWGWQLIIVSAALTLPFGITQSKEYAELEWPIDLAVVVVWVAFGINFFWTLAKRRERHLYVAIWFYLSTIITIAMLYLVNNAAIPVFGAGIKSYGVFAGTQDALVQWWYGHNAVAFFLTTPILGIMYYFLPKAADRPVYSYRLSIVHFWALVFMYIWAGPHHLLYTALPDWAQSMGMVFSLMLWAPSWGGMLNGLLTLRGAWDRVRQDPVLKFFVAAVTFYGMSTFEGPLLSIKAVSALAHYTDWIVGHAHSGALGWNGFMAAGLLYWLVPRLWGTKLYSVKAADAHFWIGTLGILLYTVAMWAAGITQGLMWRALGPDGALQYPSFVETLIAIKPLYIVRLFSGLMYLSGILLMAWNLIMTAKSGKPVDTLVRVAPLLKDASGPSALGLVFSRPVLLVAVGTVCTVLFFLSGVLSGIVMLLVFALLAVVVYVMVTRQTDQGFHRLLEGKPLVFSMLTLLAVVIGGLVEITPTIVSKRATDTPGVTVMATPYRPLELAGRDIYVREGCYTCHSQMVRPMPEEKMRYGDPSTSNEFLYDHPFQWGSKRTGPDLHRVGGKMPNLWHYQHFMDPRSTSPGSNMPDYAFLAERKVDEAGVQAKLSVMQMLSVPYTAAQLASAGALLQEQQRGIAEDLARSGKTVDPQSEMIALIAYMQRLGMHPADPFTLAAPAAPVTGGK